MTARKLKPVIEPGKIDPDMIYEVAGAVVASQMGETKIRAAINKGELRAYRMGPRLLKIKGKDLQAWLDAHMIKLENTDSSDTPTDGELSGTSKAALRGFGSASRSLLPST